MNDISAAVGIHQLRRLDGWIARRAELADLYDQALQDLPLDLPPRPPAHARHAHHLYIVRLRGDSRVGRDAVIEHMQEAQIGCSVHFKADPPLRPLPLALRPRPGSLPVATPLSETALSLPLFPAMTDADVEHVAATLASIVA